MSHQYPESQKCQTIPREPKAPDNTQRAKSARQYPESQKCQKVPYNYLFSKLPKVARQYQFTESQKLPDNTRRAKINTQTKVPDNTQRAKSTRQYPREPKVPDNTWIANYFFFQNCFENKKVASITQFT